jgi:5'-nucleotidase / UDP-sugar diphosphatase
MKIKNFFLLLTLSIVNLSLVFSQGASYSGRTEIIILHTNDMHAKIDNFAKLSYLTDSLKKTHSHVYLVSAGDNFTGNPVVDMVADKGYPMIDLMNKCQFDVSEIGNHEFDLGMEFLGKRMNQAKFPFICCNVDASGTILEQPKPYVVFDVNENLKLVVLGIIELGENGIPDSHPSKMTGLKFTDGISTAMKYSDLKKDNTVFVGLTHLGVLDDVRLAKAMPQLDLIIGGHSHTLIDTAMIVNGVMITQAGSGLKYVGKATLIVENGHIVSRKDEIIPLAKITGTNQNIQKIIDQYNSNEELKRVIGTTESGIVGYDELGSMMTDAIVHQMKVDFAFQNKGGIRISSLSPGDIKLNEIYKLDPFGNQVVIFNMTIKEIQSLICNAFIREKGIDLEVSGMTYSLTTDSTHRCLNVEMRDLGGILFPDDSKVYKVAMNSYMAASYHFDHKDPGTTVYTTTAQALIDYLTEVRKVNYKGIKRVNLIVLQGSK